MAGNRLAGSRNTTGKTVVSDRDNKVDVGKFDRNHYSVGQVADFLCFSRQTVYDWIKSNRQIISYIEINGSYRIPVKEVMRLSGKTTNLLKD